MSIFSWFQSKPSVIEGNIKKYFGDKKYGFIRRKDGTEYFFHIRDVKSGYAPKVYDKVRFYSEITPKGLAAKEISFIQNEQPPKYQVVEEGPERMMYSKDGKFPAGFVVKQTLGDVWAKGKGFNNAKNTLLRQARALGGNAVVITSESSRTGSDLTIGGLMKLSKGKIPIFGGTYKYTIYELHGKAVSIARKKRIQLA